MWFVIAAVLLIALKLFQLGPVGTWSWWAVLAPLPLAWLWWQWADFSGYTKRREMDKMDAKKLARRRKSLEALGLNPRKFDKQHRQAAAFRASRQREVEKVEGQREAKRQAQRDSVLNSRFGTSQFDGLESTQQATQPATQQPLGDKR